MSANRSAAKVAATMVGGSIAATALIVGQVFLFQALFGHLIGGAVSLAVVVVALFVLAFCIEKYA